MYEFSKMFAKPEKEVDEQERSLDRVVSRAKICLNNKDFEEYRKEFVKAEAKMIDSMISFTNIFMGQASGDMSFYGAKIARMITKLSDLRSLVDAVENDARKENVTEQDDD